MVRDVRVEESPVGPVLYAPEPSGQVILHLSSESTMDAAGELARSTGATVVCARYRPTFPAAFEDAQDAYRYCKQAGPVTLVGERIGAGLAASLLVHLRNRGTALPQRAVLVSGLLDLTMRANSLQLNARAEPSTDVDRLLQEAADYAGDATRHHPLLSPIFANLHGLAPVQLLVAGTDPLLDDSLGFATRAARSGVTVDLRVFADAAGLAAESMRAMTTFIGADRVLATA